jgi:uncharacterized protein YeaO (DUF488 family)
MAARLRLSTFRIGGPSKRGNGLRIGATRRPPRGIARERWQRDGFFDVWLPVVAPSPELLRRAKAGDLTDPAVRRRFFAAYEREMARTEPRQVIELLARLAERTPIAVGCFCADESRCHRSRLRVLIERAARQHGAGGTRDREDVHDE